MFGNYLYLKCFPHYIEYQSVCCHILWGINIMHAHWRGIQPVSGHKVGAILHDIHSMKLDNPGLGQVIGSALQQDVLSDSHSKQSCNYIL